jgi:hypothetical protein
MYTVQPVPAPFSTKALNKSNNKEGGNNQNDTLFKRGNQFYSKLNRLDYAFTIKF